MDGDQRWIGAAVADGWYDVIVASNDQVIGDGDDRELARFERTSDLPAGQSYDRNETILLPPAFNGRYFLYVRADVEDVVFEDGREANNSDRSPDFFDVMPIPYADLVVVDVNVPGPAFSGQTLDVSWRVENQGIGLTNKGNWNDAIWLATDPDGNNRTKLLGSSLHLGQLAVGDGYDRTATVTLPDGLVGEHYVVVATGGVFEFIHTDNNGTVSNAFDVQLTPPADLVVTDIISPTEPVEEGTAIDIKWTVENVGSGDAGGYWEDRVYLRKVGDPSAPTVSLGTFRYDGPLQAGTSYTRWEQLRLPIRTHGVYETVVITNYDGRLYEHGATDNNTAVDDTTIPISIRPRPDLQILDITAPAAVDPGQTVAVEFTVINQGNAATTRPTWQDSIYLSLDPIITSDDVHLGTLTNQSALEPGESYRSATDTAIIPERYRGTVYLIVKTDSGSAMDEWPNEQNNTVFVELYVTPQPLPDLVVHDVVTASQAVEGATIDVRYTVTNLGPGRTPVENWTDTIWLTRDKNRPHPGQGDVLLKSIPHTGRLDNRAGYDVQTTVTVPTGLVSGTYYITPWTDPYAAVLEDTLAINVNPDDPTEIDNNNYKARAIDIIALTKPKPDLLVADVQVTPEALGGTGYSVTWTVSNNGKGDASGTWEDEIWLAPTADVNPTTSNSLLLGRVAHSDVASKDFYTSTLDVTLSPSAIGQHVIVKTDWRKAVSETNEDNNRGGTDTQVTPVPADLLVTNVTVSNDGQSGEETTIVYTVENQGAHPVWLGTDYWIDYVWIGADATFIKSRASYFGKSVRPNAQPLQPGESYTAEVTARLPKGIGGDFFVYIHPDAHDDSRSEQLRSVQTAWWPAATGDNAKWLEHFGHWAHEDPTNNVFRAEIPIAYNEPDLVITDLQLPPAAQSGDIVDITFTVTNQGTRDTREKAWPDRFFLSRDPSLDRYDTLLLEVSHQGVLAVNESYTETAQIRLPDGIDGPFYVLAITDSPAYSRTSVASNIGFGNPGVAFEEPFRLPEHDRIWETQRLLARGRVAEYQLEGNNTWEEAIDVTRATPPDLQVTELIAPSAFAWDRISRSRTR